MAASSSASAGPSDSAVTAAAGSAAPGNRVASQQHPQPQPHMQQGQPADANMHFDTTTGKWMYENTETGQEFEWNTAANAWVPVADEEELKKQQAAYSVAGVDEEVS